MSETETSTLDAFLSWAKGHGVESDVAVEKVPDKGLGVVSKKRHFRDNSRVIFVPSVVLVNASKITGYAKEKAPKLESFYQALLRDGFPMNERIIIISFILFEQVGRVSLGESAPPPSLWKPYLDILPRKLHTPMFYNATLKACLDGSSLSSVVDAKLNKLKREFDSFKPYFNKWRPPSSTLQPDAATNVDVVTFDDFKWADGVFWSRVLSFGSRIETLSIDKSSLESGLDDFHLVPFIDIANHSLTPLARWEVITDGVAGAELILTQTSNREPIPSETEICISYGEKSNCELLFLHGFALKDDPWSAISFPVPFFEGDPIVDEKLSFMKYHGIKSLVSLSRKNESIELSHESIRAMWLCVLNEGDGLKITPCETKPYPVELIIRDKVVNSVEMLDSVIQDWELFPVIDARVVEIILDAVENLLSNLGETNERVLKLMETANSREIEYIKIYREDEHRFLESAVEEFTRKRETLMSNELVERYLVEEE
ncbi:2146_t:CDS:2 [Ambispora gerdemannii]|uniref:2146_t:CDS:1 n=1 Tax=Ambispora gerdemannii TaxID=144530 RepID=A0A9N8V947_9GLOM|nr:2146_t:CDS:2 [Ambispora gerdemannii]